MSFYRVVGSLRAWHTGADRLLDADGDLVDLDLIVPAAQPSGASYEARRIACQGYTFASWREGPVITEVKNEENDE